jgi:hypothetical protein
MQPLVRLLVAGLRGWHGREPDKPNEWVTARSVTIATANPKALALVPVAEQQLESLGMLVKDGRHRSCA